MAKALTVLLALVLTGCASPQPFVPGAVISAPPGWVGYCARNPKDADCRS